MGTKWDNGQGKISKRRDGRWMARYYDVAGVRRTLYGKRREVVATRLRLALTHARSESPYHTVML